MRTGVEKRLVWFFVVVLSLMLKSVSNGAVTSEISFDIFSQEDGLPNNQIQCIFQDSKGWMWIGTSQGLSRFDGYNFVNFTPNPGDSASLKGNLVRVIKEDLNGNLLVGTESGGLNIFDRDKEKFYHPFFNHPEYQNNSISVNDIQQDENGTIWMGTDFNVLMLDTLGNITVLNPISSNPDLKFEGNFVRELQFDNAGNLWIGTNTGVYIYNPKNNILDSFTLPFQKNQNKEIWELYMDDEGLMWIGTYSAGLFLVSPLDYSVKKLKLEPEVERSETVKTISKGFFGEYWIGTRGGFYKYKKGEGITGYFRHNENDPRSLSNTSVLSIFHDARGETWIGTRGGLNLLAKRKQVFHNYSALPGENNYLNSSIVYAFWIDEKDNIWIGTEDGGINIYDPKSGTYQYLMYEENNKNTISKNCIKAFLDDGKGNLWVGSFLGGIDIINLKTKQIKHFQHNPDDPNSLSDNRVWDIAMDNDGEIWVASASGIDKFDSETNTFRHQKKINGSVGVSWLEFDSQNNLWAGSMDDVVVFNKNKQTTKRFPEHSRTMFEDSKNRIWIATNDKGIALYSPFTGPISYYNESDGLANNHALCILEDDDNYLWISTNNGLSKLDIENNYFQNFTNKDGLSNNQFCYGAAYKTKSGDLLFGSISGFNRFNPSEIISVDNDVPLVFTDFKILYKSVEIGNDKKSVLQKSISETDHLILNYDQNIFTLEFAALNYVNSNKNMYTYRLEGFSEEWNDPSINRSATYTNLNPGDYVLHVKRVVPGNPEGGKELQLYITVLPPFWKTKWFLTLLILFIIGLIYTLVHFFINREKIKSQLVVERLNARKLHELDMLKLKFFTNISHEIRTPLTLILGPLNKLLKNEASPAEVKENLQLMHRNANNLDRLINQLLDFRKLQTGNLKLNLTEADIVRFIETLVHSFNDFADEKQIQLKFTTLKKKLTAVFDHDKIEKIINNLLSNAFKFTAPGGSVSVTLSLVFNSEDDDFHNTSKDKQFIEITVKDTGRGIPPQNIKKIFNRFFQSDEEDGNSGAGIGLALVKELVKLHKGEIFVSSKTGMGTKFTIRIPYLATIQHKTTETASLPKGIDADYIDLEKQLEESSEIPGEKIMLVVDDNPDVRQFISSHFNSSYKIIEAKNGDEGWELALKAIPDIVISDILMPVSNGYELCKRIKNDERTSHIPVLLLTAMHSKENEIKGLTTGADDYITKPFDLSVLQVKVENVLSIRESLKQKYTGTVVLEPKNVVITSHDEKFLQRAIEIVEENISDSELDIENFSVKVGVSRMQLYRKLHALTDMTVKEFIRHIRLKRASQLLSQNKMNISEVAYEVGFKDLSHFRKCFKREFGMSASEYISQEKKEK
ncbi:two-component regulator propeller domain-containing protein [uncultured Draconibacterium sp.]|uniref:hybrid sensor histidine kinase/response regulator transcription factor n=1 Tax=uncultured Draconibacterium sp. TaxID=1573823 RepID=UPI0032172A00